MPSSRIGCQSQVAPPIEISTVATQAPRYASAAKVGLESNGIHVIISRASSQPEKCRRTITQVLETFMSNSAR